MKSMHIAYGTAALLALTTGCGVDASGTMAATDGQHASPPSIDPAGTASGPAAADAGAGGIELAPWAPGGVAPDPAPAPAPAPDASAPLPPADAGAGTGAASPCAAGTTRCAATGTCVADCAKACPGMPIACFACGPGNVVVAAECAAPSASAACVAAPLVRCGCADGKPSSCPGPRNVCVGGACLACGDPGTDGLTCKAPADKACSADGKGKAEEAFTCR